MIPLNKADEIVFMALTIWREARSESIEAKTGVGYSIMNRVEKPKWWGRSIMEVLFKKWQYSSLTDPNDKQLTKWPAKDAAWAECMVVAQGVVNKFSINPVPHADSYFDNSITAPYWAEPKMFVRQIDRLLFYNVDMDYEKPVVGVEI